MDDEHEAQEGHRVRLLGPRAGMAWQATQMDAGAGAAGASAKPFVDTPVLCGHRGSGRGTCAGHRENTLGSFRAAVAAGARWVEVDARTTADGALVARHDPAVEDGRFVSELTVAETTELGLMQVAEVLEELPARSASTST